LPEIVCDNDIVSKLAQWSLLESLGDSYEVDSKAIGVLGALRFVIGPRLGRLGRPDVVETFEHFLHNALILEPDDAEIELAANIEKIALDLNLDFDTGESILVSIAINRSTGRILTGDKRALSSLPKLSSQLPILVQLKGHFDTLEHIVARMVKRLGAESIRDHICKDASCDKALTICFACGRSSPSTAAILDGLSSYTRSTAGASGNFCGAELVR
tara:strand:+ start:19895 stop:20542 length:648 start_codon:yes stop_codon:yes gene_type:complete